MLSYMLVRYYLQDFEMAHQILLTRDGAMPASLQACTPAQKRMLSYWKVNGLSLLSQ